MKHQCRAVADWLNFKLLQAGFLSTAFGETDGLLAASWQWRGHAQVFLRKEDRSNPSWNHWSYVAHQRLVMSHATGGATPTTAERGSDGGNFAPLQSLAQLSCCYRSRASVGRRDPERNCLARPLALRMLINTLDGVCDSRTWEDSRVKDWLPNCLRNRRRISVVSVLVLFARLTFQHELTHTHVCLFLQKKLCS